MHVARLLPAHAAPYRRLMLQAYDLAADAFTSTAEERAAEPESFWADRIAHPNGLTAAFGAFEGEDLRGTVALEFSRKPKTRHRALLLGMYVAPAARRRQAGRALLAAAIEHARGLQGLLVLNLTATQGNDAAIALYRAAGFEVFGIEPMAILTPGGYKAKVHMWLQLSPAHAAP